MLFIFHTDNEFTETPFLVEADSMLNAHIKFQEQLERIDEALDKAFPGRDGSGCKTTVTNVHEAQFAVFSEEWLKNYVELMVEHVEEECEDE